MSDAFRAPGYRKLAAGFREQAANCREYDLQQQALQLAEDYERLASRVEWDTGRLTGVPLLPPRPQR
jgi:hypothetical protein